MKANIIGAGSTSFGELWQFGIKEMIIKAALDALKSANIEAKKVDSLFIANCFSGTINGQNDLAAICADELLIQNCNSVGGGDASGAHAIVQAANAIISKQSKIALVIGAEKLSDMQANEITQISSQLLDQEHEASCGATLPSMYAMIARMHMKMHGTSAYQLAMVPVKNHSNALENDIAHFRFRISADDVEKSPLVSDPIRVLHSAAPCDGCCALVMCDESIAKESKAAIKIAGSAIGSDFIGVHSRDDITTFNSLKLASNSALSQAKINIKDISFAELHDSFSISEIISIEDIGLAKKGEGGLFIEKGHANIDGKTPINPSGGLKGCGHPFAATGIRQAMEAYLQLTGKASNRQVKYPRHALTANLSGTGATAVVNIYSL